MDVKDVILGYLRSEVDTDGAHISEETPLLGGVVDSLELMKLVAFIEEEFDVTLDDEDITVEHFRTVGDVERLVQRRVQIRDQGA